MGRARACGGGGWTQKRDERRARTWGRLTRRLRTACESGRRGGGGEWAKALLRARRLRLLRLACSLEAPLLTSELELCLPAG